MNFIDGKLVELGRVSGSRSIRVCAHALNLPFDAACRSQMGQEVILGLRPERITDARSAHNVEDAVCSRSK